MKTLKVLAAALGAVILATTAQAAMISAPVSDAAPGVQLVGVICGPGMHLRGLVCVPNARACPIGMHMGVGGVCRRN